MARAVALPVMNGYIFMRTFLCFIFLSLLSLCSIAAEDYQLSLKLAYSSFVKGEPVVVQMEVVNVGRSLVQTGPGKDRFFVEVSFENRYNELTPVTKAPFARPFRLEPGKKHVSKIELDKWFSLFKEGKYYAQLVLVAGDNRYESVKKTFDIVPGVPVKEGVQMFVSRQKLKRIFKVVHWDRNRVARLFLRIEDEPAGVVWDTIDLGPHLKSSDPKLDIAADGEVTIVHRATQDAFHRTVLWSLPDSLEIAERDSLLDPEVSASQRVRALYGESVEEGPVNPDTKSSWWKFW